MSILHPPSLEEQSARRLQVNRIPFIQLVHVNDLAQELVFSGTLTEEDMSTILASGGRREQAKALLTIFCNGRSQRRDWYQQLKHALRNNPNNSHHRQRDYHNLCNFMDNTILTEMDRSCSNLTIGSPYPLLPPLSGKSNTSPAMLQQYHNNVALTPRTSLVGSLQQFSSISTESSHLYLPRSNEKVKVMIKFMKKWQAPERDEGWKSNLIKIYNERRDQLRTHEYITNMKHQERSVFHKFEDLEHVLNTYDKNGQQNSQGVVLVLTQSIQNILSDVEQYSLYVKYIEFIQHNLLIPVLRELSLSYHILMQEAGTPEKRYNRNYFIRVGFFLSDFMRIFGRDDLAITAIRDLQAYLMRDTTLIDCWIPLFKGHVKTMRILCDLGRLTDASEECRIAEQAANQVQLLSFGKRLLDQKEFFLNKSWLHLMEGSTKAAYRDALMAFRLSLHDKDRYVMCDVIKQNIRVLVAKGHVSKAEKLAVFFIQYTWQQFHGISSRYIEALTTFIHMSNEFRSDDFGLIVARNCVNYCALLMGNCHSSLLAEAFAVLSSALLSYCACLRIHKSLSSSSLSLSNESDSHTLVSTYLLIREANHCAERAVQYAKDSIPDNHMLLTEYRLLGVRSILAQGERLLLDKGKVIFAQEFSGQLSLCEEQLIFALNFLQSPQNSLCLLLAEAKILNGKLRFLQDRAIDGLKLFKEVKDILFTSLSIKDHRYLKFVADYAKHLYLYGEINDAIHYCSQIVQIVECYGAYLTWVNETYSLLIQLLSEINDRERYDKVVMQHNDWLSHNTIQNRDLTWEYLHETPEKDFLKKWDLWNPEKVLSVIKLSSDGVKKYQQATIAPVDQMSLKVVDEQDDGTDDSEPDSASTDIDSD